MASNKTSIPISDLTKNITCEITLTGVKTWKARLWIGVLLFEFAVWVAGMKGKAMVDNQIFGEIVK